MPKKIDAIGRVCGKLTALDNGSPKVLCICECGITKQVNRTHFLYGTIKSCGCLLKEINKSRAYTEDISRLSSIYQNMKSRCNNPNVDCYKHYGGRGINIASEWDTFEKFMDSIPDGYSPSLELDRIDVNKDYCKQNCRWTTRSVNCYNRRTEQGGVTFCTRDSLWRAKITKDGESYQKYFKQEADALAWRLEMELRLFNENSPR
jgi:hypothetical protein